MTDNGSVMTTEYLTKRFGTTCAVDRFTMAVPAGTVCGLLGRNGSGKTTVIRMLAGLTHPTAGTGTVLGCPIHALDEVTRRRIGTVSQSMTLPGWATLEQLAQLCSGLNPRWNESLFRRQLTRYDLPADRPVATFSLGMRAKAALLLALAPEPDLLLLDEPAAGLDIIARREFFDSLFDLARQEGKSIFISSHILTDLERVIDHVVMIDQGRVVVSEPLDHLQESIKQVQVRFADGAPHSLALPNILHRHDNSNTVTLTLSNFHPALLVELNQHDGVVRAEAFDIGLSDLFVNLLGQPTLGGAT